MAEPSPQPQSREPLPKAKVKKGHTAWLFWLVPLGAALLCAWFVFRDFVATGPTITILFQNAEGVEEGNTYLKYRGAQVGQVKALSITDDKQRVKLKVRLISSAKNLARSGSVFWIVRPEVRLGGITGLRTIISGEYLAVEPGNGAPTNGFVGAEKPPPADPPNALPIGLVASNLSSLREGTSIYYRGVQVGEVRDYQLGPDARAVVIHGMIRPEYAPLVRMNSQFWNAGGINFAFSLFRGAKITAESPEAMVTGAIEFATPTEPGEPAPDGTAFVLHDKAQEEWKKWTPSIKLHLPEQASPTAAPGHRPLK